jgi:hypothetical protein
MVSAIDDGLEEAASGTGAGKGPLAAGMGRV